MGERGPRFTWQYLAFWENGALSLERTGASLAASEMAAGMAIMEERFNELHYVPGDDQWYIWDGKCHRPDDDDSIGKLVIEWGRRMLAMIHHARAVVAGLVLRDLTGDRPPAESALRSEFKRRWEQGGWDAASKFAHGLMKTAGKNALVTYMKTLCGTGGAKLEFGGPGTDGYLNCANGTVNLATGELRRHNPADMITYCLDLPYKREKASQARGFWGMLLRLCADSESAEYLLRLLGYGLLGTNPDQKVVFINGPTGSGKSKALWILGQVLGDLVTESNAELICHVRHGRNARVENSIRKSRFVCITETSTTMKIDEGQLKRITGEPVISVDEHYAKRKIRTPVSWMIVVATNEMPSVANFDGALRRRVVVVPGGPTLEQDEIDERIAERVVATEGEAILAMLVAACGAYFREGLRSTMPLSVMAATESFAVEQDSVDGFIKECCELAGGEPGWEISAQKLWQAYQEWARGLAYHGRNSFYAAMEAHDVRYDRARKRFLGVRLNMEWHARIT